MAETNYQTRPMGYRNTQGSQAGGSRMASSTTALDYLRIAGAIVVGFVVAAIVIYIYAILPV